MGADLIMYICVGPKRIKLSEARRRKVVRDVVIHRRKVLERACRDLAKTRRLSEERLQQCPDYEDVLIAFLRDECNGEEILPDLTGKEINKTLVQLVDLWNAKDYARDLNARVWKNRRIVVAGEMSWGDEPEGYGYQLLKRAQAMGLLAALGIE